MEVVRDKRKLLPSSMVTDKGPEGERCKHAEHTSCTHQSEAYAYVNSNYTT